MTLPVLKCHSKWQWRSQKPGLFALKRSLTYPGNGKATVSLYGGFLWLTLGICPFLMVPGIGFFSNTPWSTTWNLWPWIWIGCVIWSSMLTRTISTTELRFNLIRWMHLQAVRNLLSKQCFPSVVFSLQNIDSSIISRWVRSGNEGYFKLILLNVPMLLKSVPEVSTEKWFVL